MPYTEQELEDLQFYQNFEQRDELGYIELRNKYINNWYNSILNR